MGEKTKKTARWHREIPFHPWSCEERTETWSLKTPGSDRLSTYEVRVKLGKSVDIFRLKQNLVNGYKKNVEAVSSRSRAVFASGNLETVHNCPVCNAPAEEADKKAEINGGCYLECKDCGHIFVAQRLTIEAMKRFYRDDESYAATYIDKTTSRIRIDQVASPKARWSVQEFERLYGRKPQNILDIGAGGGHFVAACKKLGLKCQGLELSRPNRLHAMEAFDVELLCVDFLKEWDEFKGVDLVTFWAVLEHLHEPLEYLKKVRDLLPKESLVVVEVPRWKCLSAAMQIMFPQSVCRHLEPLSHINIFSDNSLLTAFDACGLEPKAVWYFGMDAFEMIMQLCLAMNSERPADILGPHQPMLQQFIDLGDLSDEIVLAGAPKE